MIENSINSQELINRGLAKARGEAKPWLPGPGEFCQWCLPSAQDYGLPSAQEAFDDCRKQVGKPAAYRHWKHEIVYLTAAEFGFFELKTLQDNDKSINSKFKSFERIYQSYVDQVIAGKKFSVPPENRIENHKIKITNRDKDAGSNSIKNLKDMWS